MTDNTNTVRFDDEGFKAKVLQVLDGEFDYAPCHVQRAALDKVCFTAKEQSMNEFDAAVMYMMLQLNVVYEFNSRASTIRDDIREFVRKLTSRINLLAHRDGRLSQRMLIRSGLFEVLDDLRSTFA